MSDRVRVRTGGVLKANRERCASRGGGDFSSQNFVLDAVCPTGKHALQAGLGALGVGKMWKTVEDADREDALWGELPVLQCVNFGIQDACGPGGEDVSGILSENMAAEKLVLDAIAFRSLLKDPDNRFPWEDEKGNDPLGPEWSGPPDLCRACGGMILPEQRVIADGCPCNSPRGVNHGLVPKNTCTCTECDPAQTGSTKIGARA